MKTRIISGIVLIILIAGVLFYGGNVLLGALLLLSLGGLFELGSALSKAVPQPDGIKAVMYRPYVYTTMIAAAVWYVLVFFLQDGIWSGHWSLYYFIALIMTMMVLSICMYPKRKFADAAVSTFAVIYIPVLFSFIYILRQVPGGQFYVWYIVAAAWGSETLAYFTGMIFGKHKLSPRLSPKKTIEGAVGGVIGSAVLCTVFGLIIAGTVEVESGVMLKLSMLIGFLGSLASIGGDLFASSIKRTMRIKDYSNLIPGHGGILDRFDSMLFVAPVVVIIMNLFQIIG